MANYQTLRRKRPSIQMSPLVAVVLAALILGYVCISIYMIFHKDNQLEKLRNDKYILQTEKDQMKTDFSVQTDKLKLRITELEQRVKILDIIEEFQPGDQSSSLEPDESKRLAMVVQQESKRYGYDPLLILALIATESTFRADARSKVGATGLMQMMERTGNEIAANLKDVVWEDEEKIDWSGKETLMDPVQNVRMGTFYLARLILQFGNVKNGIRAYNQGETSIRSRLRKGSTLPRVYLRRVMRYYDRFRAMGTEKPGSGDTKEVSPVTRKPTVAVATPSEPAGQHPAAVTNVIPSASPVPLLSPPETEPLVATPVADTGGDLTTASEVTSEATSEIGHIEAEPVSQVDAAAPAGS